MDRKIKTSLSIALSAAALSAVAIASPSLNTAVIAQPFTLTVIGAGLLVLGSTLLALQLIPSRDLIQTGRNAEDCGLMMRGLYYNLYEDGLRYGVEQHPRETWKMIEPVLHRTPQALNTNTTAVAEDLERRFG